MEFRYKYLWGNRKNRLFYFWFLPWISPYEYYKDDNGNTIFTKNERNYYSEINRYNPKYLLEIQPRTNTNIRLNGTTYQELNPLEGLVIRAAQAIEAYDYRQTGHALPVEDWPFPSEPSATENFQRYYQFTSTNTAEYKFTIANLNNFSALLGQEAIINSNTGFTAASYGQTDTRLPNVNNGTTAKMPEWAKSDIVFNSYFARLSYDYSDKYFVDASYRIDGSSLFGSNKRYAGFYSIGAMWNMKHEKFLKNVSWLTDLKLKASYGTTGNSGITNYLAYNTIEDGGIYNGNPSLTPSGVANKDLSWEVIYNFNVGVQGRIFDRLSFNIEFYNKKSKDMLMYLPFSLTTGVAGGFTNVGDMFNRGVDIELNADLYRTKDWYVNVSATFNYNYNEITRLFGNRDEYTVPNTGVKYQVGKPVNEFYYVISAGVDPRDGYQMWYDNNGNLTKKFSENYAQFTGKQQIAPFAGGLQLNAAWKGLSLAADFSWVAGKWTTNNDRYFLTNPQFLKGANGSVDLLNIWTTPNQETDIPRVESERHFDTSLLENSSFIRLKNLQLSYNLPDKWMKSTKAFQSVKIYGVARNLFTITKYTGYDPEADTNTQMGVYPNSKQFTFGIELTF